jgi:hypothetical protein
MAIHINQSLREYLGIVWIDMNNLISMGAARDRRLRAAECRKHAQKQQKKYATPKHEPLA